MKTYFSGELTLQWIWNLIVYISTYYRSIVHGMTINKKRRIYLPDKFMTKHLTNGTKDFLFHSFTTFCYPIVPSWILQNFCCIIHIILIFDVQLPFSQEFVNLKVTDPVVSMFEPNLLLGMSLYHCISNGSPESIKKSSMVARDFNCQPIEAIVFWHSANWLAAIAICLSWTCT